MNTLSAMLVQMKDETDPDKRCSADLVFSKKHQERITNFINVPFHLERFLFIGYLVCLDVFVSTFTTFPVRSVRLLLSRKIKWNDLTKIILILSGVAVLGLLNPSRLYHSIRGQSTVKLYVIFNVLDIADKLCSSFGLDVLGIDSDADGDNNRFGRWVLIVISIVYSVVHSCILFYQMITLNVAINSYSNALLALLVSNQFVEIKAAVFKKFDRDNLFQLSCGDVVERFQLSIYIVLIASMSSWQDIDRILFAVAAVWGSELLVDWLKHAFIGKFNHINAQIYSHFRHTLLCADGSDPVGRRIGFNVIPFACIVIRISRYFTCRQCLSFAIVVFLLKLLTSVLLVQLNTVSESPAKTDQ